MAGAWTTFTVLDGGGASRTMRAWDESGTGAGPFALAHMSEDGLGGTVFPNGVVSTNYPLTISIGQSLSPNVDLNNARLAAIFIPSAFEGEVISFQASPDNVNWSELYNSLGGPYNVASNPSTCVVLNREDFRALRYLKVRCGTAAAPVTVVGTRTFTLIAA